MNRYAQVVLLALVTVLVSVSLRRATTAAVGGEWQASFSTTGGTLCPVPSSQPEIGGTPMPPPKVQQVAIGGTPMPPPKVRQVAIGGTPMPPPKSNQVATGEAGVRGSRGM